MDIYPSNSYRSKEGYNKESTPRPAVERKKLKQVAHATKRSDNVVSKALHLDDEVAESLWTYIFQGLIGPTFKDTAYKIVTNIAHAIIFRSLSFDNKSPNQGSGYRSYTRFSDDKSRRTLDEKYASIPKYPNVDISFRDYVDDSGRHITAMEQVNDVIEQLEDTLDECGVVSVGNLYDSVGWDTFSTYYDWGWKDLSGVKVNISFGGYVLHMPKPIQIT